MDFWEFFWLIVAAFVFFAYLMMLFSIFADIFRDHELGGWGKAGWLLFLAVFTLVALLIYVVTRGKGMNERQAAARHVAPVPFQQAGQGLSPRRKPLVFDG